MKNKELSIPNKPFRFLIASSKPHAYWALGAFGAVTVAEVIGSSLPYFFKQIVDTAIKTQNTTLNFSQTEFWVFALIGAIGIMYVAWRTSGFIGMQWATGSSATGYKKLFKYLSYHSPTYFGNRFSGSVTSKVFHASSGVERLADSILWNYYPTIISFVVGGVLIYTTSALVGHIYIGLITSLLVINYILVQKRRPLVVRYAAEDSELRGKSTDIATNMSAVWQFARRPFELSLIAGQVKSRRDADIVQWKHSEVGLTINNILITFAVGMMFVFTLSLLKSGSISIGDFVMIVTLMFGMIGTLTFIGNAMNSFIRVYGEIEEGLEEILLPHDIIDFPKAKALVATGGAIEFKKVGFSYGTRRVFKDFSLSLKPGQKIGVMGPSGSGKTTFVSLLLRQIDVHEGEVTVDGQNIRKVTQDSLRLAVSIVPQEPMLFHRSIKENIAYGKEGATEEEIIAAAKRAQAHEFILETPDGYDTLVGERGVKLSGGQRQRIAIARGLLKTAPILVLDEATSSLDSESEVAIQKALKELMKEKTVIAIAHRLSTIRAMDRILVMDQGKIVQDGNHEELLKDEKGVYARLWNHQAGGFLQEDE